jgi:3-deoxy-7-phosphoheptulonate synthase
MISPIELTKRNPLSQTAAGAVEAARTAVRDALAGESDRYIAIVGPCSLHDAEATLEYGRRLAELARKLEARPGDDSGLLLVMRAYPEKSRSALGFRGLAEEPGLDGRREPERGVELVRGLLVSLAELGIPLAAEIVSPYLFRFWEDCLSWSAIGARAVEAQALRELAAALPFPCGFKNDRSGDPRTAIDACQVASRPCSFLGATLEGKIDRIDAAGNPLPHVVLRGKGGGNQPGKANSSLAKETGEAMAAAGLEPVVILDAAHGNAAGSSLGASTRRTLGRALAIGAESEAKNPTKAWRVRGIMLESNLEPGCQPPGPIETLARGVSITDPCLGWNETEAILGDFAAAIGKSRPRRGADAIARRQD